MTDQVDQCKPGEGVIEGRGLSKTVVCNDLQNDDTSEGLSFPFMLRWLRAVDAASSPVPVPWCVLQSWHADKPPGAF